MARYDRIARLDPPEREDAYDGWLSLRDLEGREREPELGRRAMIRFLALRPVRRLLMKGLDAPSDQSITAQVAAVRRELSRLPDNDHRTRLDQYLEEIGGRSPSGLVRATLDVGASAEANGHLFAAEEFYLTALELCDAHDLDGHRPVIMRRLGRIHRERKEWSNSEDWYRRAVREAEDSGDRVDRARSLEELAAVFVRQERVDEARSTLRQLVEEGGGDRSVQAIAAAGQCALELAQGRPDRAVDAGWTATRLLEPGDETRNRVLLNMAAGFRRLGLLSAADSCYRIVLGWAAWPEHRIEARLERALVAAEAEDTDAFDERRRAVLSSLSDADRPLEAMVQLGLGRGAALIGETDVAREHLREAVSLARDLDLDPVLTRAESLLETIESRSRLDAEAPETEPDDQVLAIAGRVETLAANDGAAGAR